VKCSDVRPDESDLLLAGTDDLLALADGNGVKLWFIDGLRTESLTFVPPK